MPLQVSSSSQDGDYRTLTAKSNRILFVSNHNLFLQPGPSIQSSHPPVAKPDRVSISEPNISHLALAQHSQALMLDAAHY